MRGNVLLSKQEVAALDKPQPEVEERPDLTQILKVLGKPLQIRSIAVTVLMVLALFYTLALGKEIFMPLAAALVLQLLLAPLQRRLCRLRVPEPIGAAMIVLLALSGIGLAVYTLAHPASEWVGRVPEIADDVRERLRDWKQPIEDISEATQQVENMADVGGRPAREVQVQTSSPMQRAFGNIKDALFQLGIVVIVVYFLLASGDMFKEKLVKVLPTFHDKKRAVAIVQQIESDVSTFLVTITFINIAFGACIGIAMYALGVPNPALWAAIAAVLNFVPFIGAAVGTALVAIAAAASIHDFLASALLAGAIYLSLHMLEAQFITPSILGKRLTLNPVVIIINVIFWGWLWGIPGALLAVPFLVMTKVLCDHIEPLAAIGEFLAARDTQA